MGKILYAKTHEWADIDNGKAKVGISDHAQSELKDIVFVSLPSVGDTVVQGETFCEVESVKAVSEIYSPVSGKIVAVNKELEDAPELINDDAMNAWICQIELSEEPEGLLTEDEYKAFIAG
jgi:glycine cleavage system H protein